jgi:gamma-glutamyl-gamma-aminobutyrate hydrolase PuuD
MDEGTARDYIEDLINERNKLRNTVHALQDVLNSAQQLIDAIHLTGGPSATSSGLYGAAYDNLRAALRAYYQPNGR